MRFGSGVLASVLLLFAPAAFADDMQGMKAGGNPADAAFARSMQTMMQNMRSKPTGDADKDFVDMMLPHHQGAVDMAKVELQYGRDPTLRALATSIISAQEKEIGIMKAWRAQHSK
jgi:uncharacterized protein (DUF305 family)